jgi:hypothetical protein
VLSFDRDDYSVRRRINMKVGVISRPIRLQLLVVDVVLKSLLVGIVELNGARYR